MRTRINVTMTPPTGEPNQRWRTLTILRKEPDGRWVLARDANLLPT
jgi:ketosteroid isomerase-like protein